MAEGQTSVVTSPVAGEFITRSAEDTFALARRIGERLEGRAIFLLTGDLGAGKTVFAKGLAAGLGIDPAEVTSPSYTLTNIHEGRRRMYHVDLYRLESADGIGLDEILEEENAVVVVEWAERLDRAPPDSIRVKLEYLSNSERRISIQQSD
ncbi:MAG TPA: tRNA (adenosine(37)-N6)-threonylcarbamoyltransferase complex ATPase subunit type 1 TsaE [Blastocatellia bacterium]|nr:tRNA (adenosine(37)-N6)-threonylcarbamoyltransferase complex ATPase subunit type 1 TsaE [Blastocatellia bacterium]